MFKGKNAKEKAGYFWMYYKLPFLAVLAAVLITVYWVSAAAGEKELAFKALLFDSHGGTQEEILDEEFRAYAGIDKSREVSIFTSFLLSDSPTGTYAMTSLSRFYVEVGNEELDVCGMLEADFKNYAKADCFMDLRSCLGKEMLEELKEYLYCRNGVPIGIDAKALPGLKKAGCYEDETALLGILYNSQHVETAVQYLEYLYNEMGGNRL